MASVRQLIEQYTDGLIGLPELVIDFETRPWPAPRRLTEGQEQGTEDTGPASDNSPDWIEIEPDLSESERDALRRAYDRAVGVG